MALARNVKMASRYPMLLDWDEGEVPYPGCFPVRMVLTLSCKEGKTVKRSRGPNQYWSQDYQSKGIIIRRAIREPNKDKVMRMIMKRCRLLEADNGAGVRRACGFSKPLQHTAPSSA